MALKVHIFSFAYKRGMPTDLGPDRRIGAGQSGGLTVDGVWTNMLTYKDLRIKCTEPEARGLLASIQNAVASSRQWRIDQKWMAATVDPAVGYSDGLFAICMASSRRRLDERQIRCLFLEFGWEEDKAREMASRYVHELAIVRQYKGQKI